MNIGEYIKEKTSGLVKENERLTLLKSTISASSDKLSTAIAVSELLTFATMARVRVNIPTGLMPVNGLTFVIAPSGMGKDKSVNEVRSVFEPFYDRIHKYIQKIEYDNADEEGDYKTIRPLIGGSKPTMQGMLSHFSSLQPHRVGGGYIFSSEFGAELQKSAAMLEVLELVSVLYDSGNYQPDYRVSDKLQMSELKGLNVTALFVSSPANIVDDQGTVQKFYSEFKSKLSRRALFCYIDKAPKKTMSVEDLLSSENAHIDRSSKAKEQMHDYLSKFKLKLDNILELDPEVWDLYTILKEYFRLKAEDIENEAFKLNINDTPWRALKLAGAFAYLEQAKTVSIRHLSEALWCYAKYEDDMKEFSELIEMEEYEKFHKYMIDNEVHEISFHELAKMGFVKMTTTVGKQVEQMLLMANTLSDGVYQIRQSKVFASTDLWGTKK